MIWLLALAASVGTVPAALRWLRVAQREHYLPGEVTKFAWRWWSLGPINPILAMIGIIGVVMSAIDVRWGFLTAVAQVGPVGLSVKGITSPLAWTSRLRRVAIVSCGALVVSYLTGALVGRALLITLPLLGVFAVVDLSLWFLAPYERRAGGQWVDRATAKLKAIAPEVVAITGSYGKTTTKNYVAQLLAGSRRVVASPASFNNRMGLARAINENLAPGTEVFVAEMGTYGPGEITEMCQWIRPTVSAIVAIGPVHLERFRTLENIVRSKSEILDEADVGVICVDHPLLADLARDRSDSMEIVEVSSGDGIVVADEGVAELPDGVFGANLAVALGICRALGVDLAELLPRIADLPTAEHRQSVSRGASGFTIVDDTFNSNPDGARSALEALRILGEGGATAVITPGMVELGPAQDEENRSFAAAAAVQVDHLVIVGQTNRHALLEGSAKGAASVTVVDSRDEAVEWARTHLGPGDAVLYENDLPDHYP
ncbi:MAG TPA: Mur ligase family protein [Acidimicrobiia bacterium]|nr:Mur ligase family protein [Acidimicrobiia bacterium]